MYLQGGMVVRVDALVLGGVGGVEGLTRAKNFRSSHAIGTDNT